MLKLLFPPDHKQSLSNWWLQPFPNASLAPSGNIRIKFGSCPQGFGVKNHEKKPLKPPKSKNLLTFSGQKIPTKPRPTTPAARMYSVYMKPTEHPKSCCDHIPVVDRQVATNWGRKNGGSQILGSTNFGEKVNQKKDFFEFIPPAFFGVLLFSFNALKRILKNKKKKNMKSYWHWRIKCFVGSIRLNQSKMTPWKKMQVYCFVMCLREITYSRIHCKAALSAINSLEELIWETTTWFLYPLITKKLSLKTQFFQGVLVVLSGSCHKIPKKLCTTMTHRDAPM